MAYSNEVVARARARLAQAKADRESENNAHLRIAYARVPRLREIDRALRLTMAQAAQSIFDPEQDAQSALTQARKENEALQREREWLIDANFEEGLRRTVQKAPFSAPAGKAPPDIRTYGSQDSPARRIFRR